ncbi:MAG: DUF1178 family protein [Proteobacteria bacterium]|nr:DUF1178 family protein [Pseudomonadota bacterium]MBS0492643.1 DUF1178 family protein [Pseudomonadota bacterium]
MKVLDLFCAHDHSFEGWFGSEEDFQSQLARGLVQCPMCGNADIRKGVSAPRLNLRTSTTPRETVAPCDRPPPFASNVTTSQALQTAWLQMARQIVAHTEDVGQRFASEARRMHYGEIEERAIRGQASPEQTAELLEEGIAVLPLPLPEAAKEPLQ